MKVDVSKGIEIASFHYEVVKGDDTEKDLEVDNAYGKCDNLHHRIKMTKNFSSEQFNNTFIHECIEAVNCMYCNNLLKHDQLTNLGNGLAQIFKNLGIQFVYGDKDGNN